MKTKANSYRQSMKPMGCATAHAAIMRKLLRGEIDAVLATRLSQMFVAQRTLLESTEAEQRMKSIEDAVEQLKGAAASNVVTMRRHLG